MQATQMPPEWLTISILQKICHTRPLCLAAGKERNSLVDDRLSVKWVEVLAMELLVLNTYILRRGSFGCNCACEIEISTWAAKNTHHQMSNSVPLLRILFGKKTAHKTQTHDRHRHSCLRWGGQKCSCQIWRVLINTLLLRVFICLSQHAWSLPISLVPRV